ncbi:putative heat shock protein [Streptomyces bingchenggensis BCW-1]|uniref:Putative heat shock protein n=2 Tax=Streptomyces TaxID=1883 RepID=D7C6V9_STRBB|nr:putative heat shock protein [Streptomyces bingchenggensis BCW-1]
MPVEHRLSRWRNPMAEFGELFDQMGTLLESTVGGAVLPAAAERVWTPPVEVAEGGEAYMVELELPGARREDIDIQVRERELTVSGELKEPERPGVLRRGTRRTGRFEFRMTLPGDVSTGKVSAKLADGILGLTVPKAEAAKPRHVEITGGES